MGLFFLGLFIISFIGVFFLPGGILWMICLVCLVMSIAFISCRSHAKTIDIISKFFD